MVNNSGNTEQLSESRSPQEISPKEMARREDLMILALHKIAFKERLDAYRQKFLEKERNGELPSDNNLSSQWPDESASDGLK